MAKKCKRGYKIQNGKCVPTGKERLNPLRPSDALTKFFLWATIVLVSISALMGAGFLLFGEFNETTLKILLSTLLLSGVSLLGLVSGNSKFQVVKWSGIGASAVAGIMWLLIIWEALTFNNEFAVRFTIIMSIVAFALAHSSIIGPAWRSRSNVVKTFFFIEIGLIIAVSGMLIYGMLLDDIFDVSETFWRVLGALGILDVAGSIAVPILKRVKG